jgi:prophage maintenance system killer protein
MITQETAEKIWASYREIGASEKLLADMEKARKQGRTRRDEATLKDAFGRRQHLQLGIPSGENAHTIYRVAPELAESVIKAHIAKQKALLVEANESARIELDTDTDTDTDTDAPNDGN